MIFKRLIPMLFTSSTVLLTTAVNGQEPVRILQDLIGVRGRDGEIQLQQRGYQWQNTEKSEDSAYSSWTETSTGKCIMVRTFDGRYQSIVYTPTSDCQTANSPSQTVDPTTYVTVQDFNSVTMQITEGEFIFRGILKRNGSRQFMGSDSKVRVLLNPYDGHTIVFNEATGEELYNYYIDPLSGVGEDPETMCDPTTEPC